LQRIGWKFYLVYVVLNFTNALVFWAFFPETSGIPLEEMDFLFSESATFVPGSTPLRDLAGMNELEQKTREKQMDMAGSSHAEDIAKMSEV
jgi:hypothetical protein